MITPHIFGYLSAVFALICNIPYIFDILRGKTKPQRVTWFIWTVLNAIAFFALVAKGATDSLWLSGIFAVESVIIFILSVPFGYGKGFNTRDKMGLVFAGLGLVLWYFTNEAAIALFIAIGIGLIGGVLTIIKGYEHPETETLSAWIMGIVAGIFALFAVGRFDIVLLAAPTDVCVVNGAVIAAILLGYRRRRLHPQKA